MELNIGSIEQNAFSVPIEITSFRFWIIYEGQFIKLRFRIPGYIQQLSNDVLMFTAV